MKCPNCGSSELELAPDPDDHLDHFWSCHSCNWWWDLVVISQLTFHDYLKPLDYEFKYLQLPNNIIEDWI